MKFNYLRFSAFCAVLLCTAPLRAQFGIVRNALGGSRVNVIAPQMLATVTESAPVPAVFVFGFLSTAPFTAPVSTPSSAKVFIRAAGSSTAIPTTVVSATTGTNSVATFVVPAGIPLGTAQVYWQFGTAPYRFASVTVAANNFIAAPGIRRLGSDGSTFPVGLATPAMPGQTLVITGSGLGYGTTVGAVIGGAAARVIYAGHGPAAGYDTLHVEVPPGATGCYVPLQLSVGGLSVATAVSITSDGTPCAHPLAFIATDLKSLDSGKQLALGRLDISSRLIVTSAVATIREESAILTLSRASASELFPAAAPLIGCTETLAEPVIEPYFGAVSVYDPATEAGPAPPYPDLGLRVTLVGDSATYALSGFRGTYFFAQFEPTAEFPLTSPRAPVLSPGNWTLSIPGSLDVAPTSLAFTVPKALQLAGSAIPQVPRTLDRTFTWDGTSFSPADIVTLSLRGTSSNTGSTRTVTCAAPARAGSVTAPAARLSPFEAPSLGTVTASFWLANPRSALRTTTKNGTPLILYVNYTSSDTRPVDFQ